MRKRREKPRATRRTSSLPQLRPVVDAISADVLGALPAAERSAFVQALGRLEVTSTQLNSAADQVSAEARTAEQRVGVAEAHRCPRCLRIVTMRSSTRTRSSSVESS